MVNSRFDRKIFMRKCDMCGSEFQFGIGSYNGKHISCYNITVCNNCYHANEDGWAPYYENRLLSHLKLNGISPPARNKGGWIPRGR